jgi:hypothetical protein
LYVRCVAAAAGDLTVLDASELVVLLPQVGFDDFRRRQEAQDRLVSLGQASFGRRVRYLGQQADAECRCARAGEERSAICSGLHYCHRTVRWSAVAPERCR